jgi:hypothetical protein
MIKKLSIVYALSKSLQHAKSPQFIFISRCLVTAFNNTVSFSASVLNGSWPRWLATDSPLIHDVNYWTALAI